MDRMQRISTRVLTYIREGMEVIDAQDRRVGTVVDIYMGEASETDNARGTGPASVDTSPDRPNDLVQDIAEALFPGDTLPEVVRASLLRHGYIRIDRNWLLPAYCYAMPEHIATVSDNRVHLAVNADDLIRPSMSETDEGNS
jgi:hypothetical protein